MLWLCLMAIWILTSNVPRLSLFDFKRIRGCCINFALYKCFYSILFYLKCARCRDKGVGDDPCVLKKDCPICKAFTADQIQQLATCIHRTWKEKEQKTVSASPCVSYPHSRGPFKSKTVGTSTRR